jgi:hypothetical protein
MAYSWPIQEVDRRMDEALDIALDYLERTGQAYPHNPKGLCQYDRFVMAQGYQASYPARQ